jgi:hypothetical protein
MQWRKTQSRASALSAGLAAALLLSACGSGTERRATPRPTLPREVALRLARSSDGVAAALAAGDNCRALTLARALRQQASAAVVPAALRPQLQASTTDLAGRIECTPPALPPTVAAEPDEHGKDHDKGKHKGEKKHGKEHD